ncbi:MAG TPA: DUF3488 and transglutaminase-like domain-containing protein, partial [Mycobacteriales bacterium]|nr:DUF3488 and transglutaminase-like domain-containing protein [Mycobacteriales bacterium]
RDRARGDGGGALVSARAKSTVAAAAATLLAAASLGAVMPDQRWWVPVTFAVLVASGCGALGRRLPGPAPLLPLITPLGLVVVVTAVGAAQTAWLGFIPRTATLPALRALVRAGLDDVRQYAPPAPTTHGLMLLAAAGVYVVAAVVDLLAVTARRPALAGVPLLVLVAVPAIERNGGIGLVRITLAALGWLLLLALDGREQLLGWGRALGRNPIAEGSAALGGAAGRVAGVSLLAALVIPVLIPPVQSNALAGHGRATGCCSSGTLQIIAPLTTIQNRLHGQDVDLLKVTTDNPEYLRLTSLDAFDGNQFTQTSDTSPTGADVDGALEDATPPLTSVTTVHMTATGTDKFGENLLPLPYEPTVVRPASGHWVLAPRLRVLFSPGKDTTRDLTYTATSIVATPSAVQLQSDGTTTVIDSELPATLAVDTALPQPVPAAISVLADQITAGAPTQYDKARALEHYLSTTGGYAYNLSAQVDPGYDGLVTFLVRDKVGYCEQFASAYVVLARSLGIPARVAVGFTPGTQNADGTWTISTHDAHAWPEVWFPSSGWIRFEPTPRPDTTQFLPGYDTTAPRVPTPSVSVPNDTGEQFPTPPKKPATGKAGRSTTATSLTPQHHHSLFWPITLLVFAAVVLAPAVAGAAARRARWTGAGHDPTRVAHAAWASLRDAMTDTGVPSRASETPRATARRLGELLRGAVDEPLTRLAGAQESARYAPAGAAGLDVGHLRTDAQAVRLALLSRLPTGPRLRARFIPPSVVERVRGARSRLRRRNGSE